MKLSTILLVFLISIAQTALALTEGVQKLVEFETTANAAAERSSVMMMMPHLEIPLGLVSLDFAKRIDPAIASSLVFEKFGKKYVRWILNPEDTKWGQEVIESFKAKGLNLEIKYYYKGYQTASRSYIAEDPTNGAQFSVKSSTNVTGGAWKDKKQPIGEAVDGRLMSDFFYEQNRRRPFENFIIMDEPAIMKIESLDQAVVIRDIGKIRRTENKKYFVPGFSVLFDSVGKDIAAKNGSNDPYAFWTEHYVKVAGKALGELAARTGVQFDSPHSQNFLVELDANWKPTGKLVLRDMSDLYIEVNFLNALLGENNRLVKSFTQNENKHTYLQAAFGPLHGNKSPSWISNEQYNAWNQVFFGEYESSFKNISGFDLAVLQTTKSISGQYFSTNYNLKDKPDFKAFFEMMKTEGVVRPRNQKMLCLNLFTGS